MSISTIYASDSSDNITANADKPINHIESNDINILESTNDDDILGDSPKTITVPFDPQKPNDVLWPKIQPAIDSANSGDTIIIEGSPVHVHATINKTLNIISKGEKTTIDACPHHTHEGLDEHGVFYITKDGSGSTIQGFTFINKDKAETPFSIYIDGARDITISDCTMNYINPQADKLSGIIIKNANNVKLSNLLINNTINGITIINSSNIDITDCILSFNDNYAIAVIGDSKNINIISNTIKNNGNMGINLASADNINILNNHIEKNGLNNGDIGSGIYVNTNITKLIVKGNIFLENNLHAIMYDYRARNLNNKYGSDELSIVDNNYFEGHKSMVLHHRTYVERDYGTVKYDAENDVYGDVGEGHYVDVNYYVYMRHAFIFQDIPCGYTYYTTAIPWSLNANGGKYDLSLRLSDIVQVKNGVYQVSIVDSDGNVARDFNNFYMTFFLNDCNTVNPQQGNVYKKVLIQNGVATADFRDVYSSFKTSGNTVTAVFPGASELISRNPYKQLNASDSNIPINPSTSLVPSSLTTYPLSDNYMSVRLVDSKGNGIAGESVKIRFDGHTYTVKTNKNGFAKVKVSLISKKTYNVVINYPGSDDFKSSKITSKILVKTGSKKSKIKASNMKVKKNKKKTFKLKLTSGNGKALKSQKVTVKVNGKTYSLKTNSKGIAKISLKFKKAKKYKISMKFLGNANYKAVSKTNTITVTKK